jgi:putative oxidoreductase
MECHPMASTLMNKLRHDDLGKLLIRLAVGGMMLLHGIGKIKGGVGGIEDLLKSKGLPGFMAYGSYLGEVVAPILILIGLLTRPAGAVLAFTMVTAIGLAHDGDIVKLDPQSNGWVIELPMLYLMGGLALVFFGAGKYSVSRGKGPMD